MKKSLLVKLAQLQLAINHVLRNRQMTKQAFWPFSSKPKYKFQTDPYWQTDPEAVNEFLQQESADLDKYINDAYIEHKWFPKKGPALKLHEKNPDLKYLLANKYNIDLNNYNGNDYAEHNPLLDVFPKDYVPLKDDEQKLLQDYIDSRNSVEKELGSASEAIGPEQAKYYLNKGVRGLADIDDWLYLINSRGDRGEEAFTTPAFYKKQNAVQNLIEQYREKYNRLPSDALKILQEFANLNNKYVDADTNANSYEKDVNRLSMKDIQDGGKDSLRDMLLWLRFTNDYDALDYEKAMRRDPAYEEIKKKLFELGKKYNVEPLVPWER